MITVPLPGREYFYDLPRGTNPTAPAPVVLVLHALGIDANLMARATRFSELADDEGFIAVYPNGIEAPNLGFPNLPPKLRMWNAGPAFAVAGVDDVAFIKSVLGDLKTRANVDPERTFVAGMSNGAMMAYRLAAQWPSMGTAFPFRLKAIAAVAGTMLSATWKPSSPAMPVLHIHGTADDIVLYDGAEWHPSAEKTAQAAADFNKCGPPTKTAPVPGAFEKWDYGTGPLGGKVVFYRILDGGHTWPNQPADIPTSLGGKDLGKVSRDLDATRVIWEFFKS